MPLGEVSVPLQDAPRLLKAKGLNDVPAVGKPITAPASVKQLTGNGTKKPSVW
jgi:hypothetical protein